MLFKGNNNIKLSGRFSCVLFLVLFSFVFTGTAFAQEDEEIAPDEDIDVFNKNLYFFLPPTDGSGLVTTWGSEPIGHLGFHLGTFMDFAHRPMEYTDPQDKVHTVIYNQTGVNILFGFGLWDALNFSGAFVSIPNSSYNSRYQEVYGWEESGTGDARASVKYMLTNRRTDGLGIAFLGEAALGNGDPSQFISDEQVTISPRLILDYGNSWLTFVLNGGYKYYTDGIDGGLFRIPAGDEFLFNTGATIRFLWGMEFVVDFASSLYTEETEISKAYSEINGALRSTWFGRNPLRLTIGASMGTSDGVGTPISRFYGGFNFFFREIGLP